MARRRGKRKQVPLRTCVACRAVRPKRELTRIVRTAAGEIVVDPTGKRNGRGAYLCPQRGCWEKAIRGRQLEHALRGTLTEKDRVDLLAYASDLTTDR
jgi:hypothetical protein